LHAGFLGELELLLLLLLLLVLVWLSGVQGLVLLPDEVRGLNCMLGEELLVLLLLLLG